MDRFTRYLTLDGARTAYLQHTGTSRGVAPRDVVIVPTLLAAMRGYLPTFHALAGWARVTLVEPPGSGVASRLSRPWGFDDYARWLARFLDAMDLRRVVLVGHSNSGATVLHAAAQDPSRIAGLAICGCIGGDPRPSAVRTIVGRSLDALLEPHLSLTRWPYLMHNLLVHPANFTRHVFLSIRADLTDTARRVPVPTLLAWGAHDHTTPPRCRDRLAALLPRATLYTSPRGSHDWLIARPEEFSAAVERFTATLA